MGLMGERGGAVPARLKVYAFPAGKLSKPMAPEPEEEPAPKSGRTPEITREPEPELDPGNHRI